MNPVVTTARDWIGTPYMHQASVKWVGCDCLGLLRGIWRELVGPEPEVLPAYSGDWAEMCDQERLWAGLARYLVCKPVEDAQPGDVVLFRMRRSASAKHLGIQGDVGRSASFVHAYSGHGVTESALDVSWENRLVARFTLPKEKT